MNDNSEPPLKRARVLKVPVDELMTKDILWKSLDDFQWDKECLGKSSVLWEIFASFVI